MFERRLLKCAEVDCNRLNSYPWLILAGLPGSAEGNRESAIRKLKLLGPALFGVGFLFYVAVTIFPLAGMPAAPLNPLSGTSSALLWLAIACASGGLFALFGVMVVVVSASNDD
jgi:hypothetical protein